VVCYGLVDVDWNVKVSSGGRLVARGVAGIIILHTLGAGELELSPSLEDESPLLCDSLRMACSDGEPLSVMPPHSALKLVAFG
jgi:hypothetical protein